MGRGGQAGLPTLPLSARSAHVSARSVSAPPSSARSTGSGGSVWREVLSQLQSDYQASPTAPDEPEVRLSLSMVGQLKAELARDVRKIVREELWRPLAESCAVRPAAGTEGAESGAELQMSVGQLTVTGFNEAHKRQGPQQASVPASLRSCPGERPRVQDSVDVPPTFDDADGADEDEAERSRSKHVYKCMNRRGKYSDEEEEEEHGRSYSKGNPFSEHLWETTMDCVPCCRPCLTTIRRAFNLLGNVEAPRRSDLVSKFAESRLFEALVHATILLNSVFMFYAAEMEVLHYDDQLPDLVHIGELFFFTAYSIEFVVKGWRYRIYYFVDSSWRYNWLDFFLLVLMTFSIFFEDSLPNFSWLRMLRMLRLFKVVRVLRLISVVKPLRAILRSLYETLGTLFWSVTLLALILAVFSLVFVLRVASYLKYEVSDDVDDNVVETLLENYGGISITFHNLFEATTGGNDWSVYFHPLYETGIINCGIYYFFVVFTQIAVLNVILGVFVDTAMKSIIGDKDERAQEHAQNQKQVHDDLTELCIEMDGDKDGKLSPSEWRAAMVDEKLMHYLEMMEWRPREVRDLLEEMCHDSADGCIDINLFVRACMRFKGPPSCFDMQVLLHELYDLKNDMRSHVAKKRSTLRSGLASLRSGLPSRSKSFAPPRSGHS